MRLELYLEGTDPYSQGWNDAMRTIASADVRENVHAHWEERTMMNLSPNWKITVCSACKQEPYYDDVHGYILSDFCPNCGARMEDKDDGTDAG